MALISDVCAALASDDDALWSIRTRARALCRLRTAAPREVRMHIDATVVPAVVDRFCSRRSKLRGVLAGETERRRPAVHEFMLADDVLLRAWARELGVDVSGRGHPMRRADVVGEMVSLTRFMLATSPLVHDIRAADSTPFSLRAALKQHRLVAADLVFGRARLSDVQDAAMRRHGSAAALERARRKNAAASEKRLATRRARNERREHLRGMMATDLGCPASRPWWANVRSYPIACEYVRTGGDLALARAKAAIAVCEAEERVRKTLARLSLTWAVAPDTLDVMERMHAFGPDRMRERRPEGAAARSSAFSERWAALRDAWKGAGGGLEAGREAEHVVRISDRMQAVAEAALYGRCAEDDGRAVAAAARLRERWDASAAWAERHNRAVAERSVARVTAEDLARALDAAPSTRPFFDDVMAFKRHRLVYDAVCASESGPSVVDMEGVVAAAIELFESPDELMTLSEAEAVGWVVRRAREREAAGVKS